MGLFRYDYNKEGKGVDKNVFNRPRIIIFFDIFFRKFWDLITLNLLFILACIPIITIGPAIAGLTKVLRNYAREEHAFIWSDFWEAFKTNFFKGLVLGIIDIVFAFLFIFNVYFYIKFANSGVPKAISLSVMFLGFTIFVFMNYYAYLMLVTFKLNLRQIIKNSFIFAWVGFWRNILTTIIVGLTSGFILLTINSLIPILLLLFLHFSFCGLVINFNVYPLVKKHMMDGYDPKTGEKLPENNED